MKKVFLFLISLIFIGCSATKTVELNHEEIMVGDLSSIEGEYVNSEGHVILLDAEEFKQIIATDVKYLDSGIYTFDIYVDDGMLRIGFEIYPVGVEGLVWKIYSNDILLKTDASKIRIRYAQAEATSETEYYYKKD